MTTFVQGRPITTTTPVVTVDPGMPAGNHRFQLVVVDNAGLQSRPDVAVVRISSPVAGPGVTVPPMRIRNDIRSQR